MSFTKYNEIRNAEGEWVAGDPTEDGQQYRQVLDFGNDKKSYVELVYQAPVPEASEYSTQNEAITSGDSPLQGLNNTYYAPVETEVKLTTEIVDEQGQLQSQLDQTALGYPPVLKMPVVKFAGGINGSIIDEVYFTVTLNGGVLTATGKLPTSGDWKLLTGRLNAALKSIGANWEIERANTTFLV